MDFIDFLGLLAGTLTAIAFIPQVLKTRALKIWRSRSGRDISAGMFVLFSPGLLLWLIYGVSIHAFPIILANGVTLVLALSILVLKLRFDVNS